MLGCTYLDPDLYDYSFDDSADLDRLVAWRIEEEGQLCTYTGAVMDCYAVSMPQADTLLMTFLGTDEALEYRVVEGNQCQ
ncbi:MAG: hypothetical protein ACFCVH_01610 [Alphaproteobacteria bacterium]